jgi:dCTP deaminase
MALLTDKEISALADLDIFQPYVGEKRRKLDNGTKAISYGLSQAGYDIRLSPKDFVVFDQECYDECSFALNPKEHENVGRKAVLMIQETEGYFILPPHSFALGTSLELITMPKDVMGICQGKSTYARLGLVVNTTPAEPGWSGHFTMCFINPTPFPIRLYANEGIAQFLLIRLSGDVDQAYTGSYQNQKERATLSAVGSDYRYRLGL